MFGLPLETAVVIPRRSNSGASHGFMYFLSFLSLDSMAFLKVNRLVFL